MVFGVSSTVWYCVTSDKLPKTATPVVHALCISAVLGAAVMASPLNIKLVSAVLILATASSVAKWGHDLLGDENFSRDDIYHILLSASVLLMCPAMHLAHTFDFYDPR